MNGFLANVWILIPNFTLYSQTVVMQNMYVSQHNSAKSADGSHLDNLTDHEIQEQFEQFFEEVRLIEKHKILNPRLEYCCKTNHFHPRLIIRICWQVFFECEEKYGEIEEMCVCDNQCDHLRGNVYIKFRREEDAVKASPFN